MRLSFIRFVEDADEVIKLIRNSPNHLAADATGTRGPTFWDDYKDRWGVRGEFAERKLPVALLVKLIRDGRMKLSATSDAEITRKMPGAYSKVIVSRTRSGESQPLAILDGSHSLVAAFRAGAREIDAVISPDALKWLGLK